MTKGNKKPQGNKAPEKSHTTTAVDEAVGKEAESPKLSSADAESPSSTTPTDTVEGAELSTGGEGIATTDKVTLETEDEAKEAPKSPAPESLQQPTIDDPKVSGEVAPVATDPEPAPLADPEVSEAVTTLQEALLARQAATDPEQPLHGTIDQLVHDLTVLDSFIHTHGIKRAS